MFGAEVFAQESSFGAADLPGIGALIVALVGGYFTWQSQRDKTRVEKGVSAIEGFNALAEDQRTDLIACKKELRETRTELVGAERTVHEQGFTISEQAREIAAQALEIERLKARVAALEGAS